MPSLTLDISPDSQTVMVRGDITSIRQNRRLLIFLSNLQSTGLDGREIQISATTRALGPFIRLMRGMFEQHGFEVDQTPALTSSISGFLHEQERFVEFSQRAREIWNNNLDNAEFAEFVNSLEQTFPERRLYRLQLLAAYHLAFSQNAANFSVPGAGKTSIVYGAYAYLKSLPFDHPKHVNKLLVIGPLSSFGPWEDEFQECFGRAPLSHRLSGGIHPGDRKRVFYSENSNYTDIELLLTSYQSASNDVEDIQHYLERPNNKVMVVLDEAHKIKNTSGGAWAEAVLELAQSAKARVVLTGTPAPNGYEDLYNLFKFIWPTQDIMQYNLNHLRDMSQAPFDSRISTLIGNISPFFIRIRKSDLGLPVPIEHPTISVPFSARQEQIYRFIEDKYVGYFESRTPNSWVRDTLARARLIRLMQAATNPGLLRAPLDTSIVGEGVDNSIFVDDAEILGEILNYSDSETPAKLAEAVRLTRQILDRDPRNKIVIWCVFVENLFLIQTLLRQEGIDSRLLYGGIPTQSEELDADTETRESIIREFGSEDSRFRVVIANPFAVGESISLHKACRNAIYVERNFNAAAFLQSKDRIHRYGLPSDAEVNYYYLTSQGSVDETVHQRLLQKEATMMRVLESQPIPLLSMNMDVAEGEDASDIAAIIRDYANRRARIQ